MGGAREPTLPWVFVTAGQSPLCSGFVISLAQETELDEFSLKSLLSGQAFLVFTEFNNIKSLRKG